jgi:putative DNA primase/helicase
MALKGLRMAFASENDEGRRFSPSKVKWLSGGDTLVGRYPYDKYDVFFQPTHTLFLLTNDKPHAPANDFAFWERIHLIPFPLSFVDNPRHEKQRPKDKFLMEKLEEEASGILAWLVRGCLAWLEKGLRPPAKVLEATEEYRREEDVLADFIDECLILDPEASEQAANLYTLFVQWWEKNISKRTMSNRKFGQLMKERFEWEKKGTIIYHGIEIRPDHVGEDGQFRLE